VKYLKVFLLIVLIVLLESVFSGLVYDLGEREVRPAPGIEVTDPERVAREWERSTPVDTREVAKQQLATEKAEPSETLSVGGMRETPKIGEGVYPTKEKEPSKLYFIDEDGTIRVWDPSRQKYQIIK